MAEVQQLKVLCESLMASQVAGSARTAELENQLEATQTKLSEAAIGEQHRLSTVVRLEAELHELKLEHEESKLVAASCRHEVEQLRSELARSEAAQAQLLSGGRSLVESVCALLLAAHEAEHSSPRLEPPSSKATRVAAGTTASEQQAALHQANFEAALMAFNSACQQTDELLSSVRSLADPLACFREAMHAAVHSSSQPASAPSGAPYRWADSEKAREWRERVQQQRLKEMEADGDAPSSLDRSSDGVASSTKVACIEALEQESANGESESLKQPKLVSTKFEVIIPQDASPGDTLFVGLPGGDEVSVVIPADAPAGSVLTCSALARSASSASSI